MVLNNDGSPNHMPPMDMFGGQMGGGSIGGPKRPKQRKDDMFPPTLLPQFPTIPPNIMQMQLQHLQNQFGPPKLGPLPPYRLEDPGKIAHKLGEASNGNHSPNSFLGTGNEEQMRCDKCEFVTVSKDVFRNHMMLHAGSERGALHQLLTSPLQLGKRPFPEHNRSSEELPFSPRIRSSSPSSPASPFGLRHVEKSESPSSSGSFPPHLSYFNKMAMSNPLFQNLLPNPALRALMEERHKESLSSTPDSMRDTPVSPLSRESAPLPPNKRHKADIFSALYASRMSEASEKAESPNGALDLSKETVVGGGSHGSSSDVDTGSNPRSHSSSPALSSSTGKNRRKGKAYKIERRADSEEESHHNTHGSSPSAMPSLVPIATRPNELAATTCKFCGIAFQNELMYRLHMDYHGYENPFKCNQCGEVEDDALAFFLHIARREHR